MSLRIRRGTDAQRTGVTFDQGELVYTTDGQQLWVGDGITQGGANILSNSAGTGLIWNASTNKFDFNTGNLGLTTSVVSEGANKYFTTQRAQDAAASLFTATGTPTATGLITGAIAPATVTVNSIAGLVIGEPFIVSGTGGIARGLTAGTYYIVSASGTSVVLASTQVNATSPTPVPLSTLTTGSISATTFAAGGPDSGITFVYDSVNHVMNVITSAGASSIPTQAGHSGQFLTTNGSSTNWASIITSVSGDTNPALGGNLTLSGYNITGNGSIAITSGNISTGGTISATTGLGGNLALGGYSINGSGTININGTITSGGFSTSGPISAGATTVTTINASTGLGGNLNLNGYNISGSGFIAMTGGVAIDLTTDLQLRRTVDGVNANGYITSKLSRGTLTSPTAVHAGDELGGILIRGNTDISTSGIVGLISFVVDPTAVIAGGNYIKSQIVFSAATDTGQDPANAVVITSDGAVTSNAHVATKYTQLAVYANDAARTSSIPTPVKGMMVFMTAGTAPSVTNKAVIYNGTAWALMPG